MSEEEVRAFFVDCGKIENVRLVRDPRTFIGKGIGYIMFSDKEAMRKAVDTKHDAKFKGRNMRVKKASDPKRLEKKQRKKAERAAEHAKRQPQQADSGDSDAEEEIPRNFGDMISSDDSEDEKPAKKAPSSFDRFANSQAGTHNKELKLDNMIAFNKKKRTNMLKEMIENKTN